MAEDDFLKDWLEGKISKQDLDNKRLLSDSGDEFEDLENIILATSQIEVPKGRYTKEDAWKKFTESPQIQDNNTLPIPKRKTRPLYYGLGIAASLALALTLFFIINRHGDTTIITKNAEHLTAYLPDGSSVKLNSSSSLSYNEDNWKDTREVSLEGEAFFEVKKGSDFIVKGKTGRVKVVGTSFNAYFRNNQMKVECFTGAVEVSLLASGKKVTLQQGDQTKTVDNDLKTPTHFDSKTTGQWRVGEFHFENTPLMEVIQEFERQYDVKVVGDHFENRYYTGYFNNQNINEAAKLVFAPMGIGYELDADNKTVFTK